VDELRSGPDEPGEAARPDRGVPEDDAGEEALRQRVEPRSRTEYAADLEQQAVSGWAQAPFRSCDGEAANTDADRSAVNGSPDAVRMDAPAEALRRFEPRRAGLPEVSAGEAAAYLDAHRAERPWLAAARGCSPEVQRIFAALDQGGGHAHIRHEGWVTEEMNHRRVAYLEDPAQLDLAKRAARIDGIMAGNQLHRCGSIATRITDPEVFAAGVARAVEHPDVRAALEKDFKERRAPGQVILPITDLLGSEGHRYCTGWQLDVADGNIKTARERRDAFAESLASKVVSDGPEPKARPVRTFEGGTIALTFGPNHARDGYEIVTMYAKPPESA
jgi:hypothetical protein